jgi:hypothetical protein
MLQCSTVQNRELPIRVTKQGRREISLVPLLHVRALPLLLSARERESRRARMREHEREEYPARASLDE